jgi:hypothetical protein
LFPLTFGRDATNNKGTLVENVEKSKKLAHPTVQYLLYFFYFLFQTGEKGGELFEGSESQSYGYGYGTKVDAATTIHCKKNLRDFVIYITVEFGRWLILTYDFDMYPKRLAPIVIYSIMKLKIFSHSVSSN